MSRLKIKSGSGIYKRNIRLNEYIDSGDYYSMVVKSHNKIYTAKIDKEDYKKVATGKWSWSYGYLVRYINNEIALIHHIIQGKKKGYFTDHINGDRLDNRKANLRFVTMQQNNCNRSKMRGVYISNYYKNKKEKKWVAHIIYKEKFHYLGIYSSEEEALKVRKEAEIKYFGEFRRI